MSTNILAQEKQFKFIGLMIVWNLFEFKSSDIYGFMYFIDHYTRREEAFLSSLYISNN